MRLIRLPTTWHPTVATTLTYIQDRDTGDEDPAEPLWHTVVVTWRRAE